jgi:predicted nucleic acid-binding protein
VAQLTTSRGRLILDAGGVSAIADGHGVARAALERARREGWLVVIPAPVLTEVHTGRRDHARIDLVINAVDMLIETTPERAKQAGELRSRSGVLDVVDAIVVAEALAAPPALIMTSDPGDIRALVEAAGAGDRIRIIAV